MPHRNVNKASAVLTEYKRGEISGWVNLRTNSDKDTRNERHNKRGSRSKDKAEAVTAVQSHIKRRRSAHSRNRARRKGDRGAESEKVQDKRPSADAAKRGIPRKGS